MHVATCKKEPMVVSMAGKGTLVHKVIGRSPKRAQSLLVIRVCPRTSLPLSGGRMYMQNFYQGNLCGWDGDPGSTRLLYYGEDSMKCGRQLYKLPFINIAMVHCSKLLYVLLWKPVTV